LILRGKNLFIGRAASSTRHLQQVQRDRYSEIFAQAGLRKEHLIFPVFVSDRQGSINSMPGMSVTPVEKIADYIQTIADASISSIIVFGIPKTRDSSGSPAADKDGIVQQAVRTIKSGFSNSMNITTDVCVCQYNLSGHCGILHGGRVDNDATLGVLAEIAKSHAEAGADVVAPSSMMDGQVHAIRNALATKILSYSAKHASSLYTPFRSAAFANAKLQIDKSPYQVSYANKRQVMMEIETDINEGADMVMIKPALAYLDLVRMAKDKFNFPIAVQNVSGEYAMIKAAAMQEWIDEEEWKVCSIASIRRAGADRIISYFSLDVAKYL
jgi:porphobilinogen synthase